MSADRKPPVSLIEAIGSLVSECADQRDVYPDAATALEAITDHINEIYACMVDGVFSSPDPARDALLQREAREAMREEAAKVEKLAFVHAFAAGFKCADETGRQCILAMDDAWEEYAAIRALASGVGS